MRSKNFLLNFVTGSGGSIVAMILGFFATPIILKYLGQERLGAFRALLDTTGYLALVEFGLYGALQVVFSKYIAASDTAKKSATFRVGMKSYLWVVSAIFLISIPLYFLLPVLVPVRGELLSDLNLAYLFIVLTNVFLPVNVFRAVIDAEQRTWLNNVTMFVQGTLAILASIAAAAGGLGIMGQALALFPGMIIAFAIVMFDRLKNDRQMLRSLSSVKSRHVQMEIRRSNWPVFLSQIGGRVSLMSDNIIISICMGPAAIVPFFLTQKLQSIVGILMGHVGSSSWAGMSDLYYKEGQDKFNAHLLELTKVIGIVSAPCLATVVGFNEYFIGWWVGEENFAGILVTGISAVNVYFLAIYSFWGFCFLGTGKLQKLIPITIAQTILNLAASVMLTMEFGVVGPVGGTLVSYLLVHSLWFPQLLKTNFGFQKRALIRAMLVPMIAGCGLAFVSWQVAEWVKPNTFPGLALVMGSLSLAGIVCFYHLLCSGDEKKIIQIRLRNLRR